MGTAALCACWHGAGQCGPVQRAHVGVSLHPGFRYVTASLLGPSGRHRPELGLLLSAGALVPHLMGSCDACYGMGTCN